MNKRETKKANGREKQQKERQGDEYYDKK